MGLFSGITNAIKSVTGLSDPSSFLGPLASAGASLLGGVASNSASAASVKSQESFQARERLSTYPDTVASLKAAGLNPMLAYSNGGLPVPSGANYSAQDVMSPAVQSFNSTKSTSAATSLQGAQTAATTTQADLNGALALKAKQDTISSAATARNTDADTALTMQQLSGSKSEADWNASHPKTVGFGNYVKNILGGGNAVGNLAHGISSASGAKHLPSVNLPKLNITPTTW